MVADNLWWSVWWPWVLVWLGTGLALVAAIFIVFVAWRGHRKRTKQPPYLSFYLHENSVMALYQYKYKGALEQEVQARVGGSRELRVGTSVPMVAFGGNLERNREEFRRYLEVAAPITVIGILMDVLEDDLVHVDLERGSIVPSKNLGPIRRAARLSELGGNSYVLARGIFHIEASPATASSTMFLAPYGPPAATGSDPMIRVRCVNSGLRDDVPEGHFWARCLGTVQGWDARNGHLILDPIAIFK